MIGLNVEKGNLPITLEIKEYIGGGGGGDGNSQDYEKLVNKPKINDVVLEGNKTLDELGITKVDDYTLIQGIL